jgi:ADP-heptose:LPS heptosyltransferase
VPLALVAAGGGIGDVVRATPLVRVLAGLGCEVDVLLVADYRGTAALLRGAPEIRRLFVVPSPWCRDGGADADGLDAARYDVAVATLLAAPHRGRVRADRWVAYDRAHWLRHGDTACAARAAAALGWTAPLPPPFVRHSGRAFDLAPGTVALHPGCKPGWGWKRWHGFPELAARFPDVALVGTDDDLRGGGTYFGALAAWPPQVRSFVGRLDLADTAALLAQSAALVSNDSGLLHVAAALETPAFGIFGITSPAREMMPLANAVAVTKGLPCEPACRRRPWGRRDCEHHLECLRTLTPDEVADRVAASVAGAALATAPEPVHG